MLLINPRIVILQGTGSQVTPGFPHVTIRTYRPIFIYLLGVLILES